MIQLATVQVIRNITPIDGADKIEKCNILGWEVVIPKNEFKDGDLVCYCEIDSIMPNLPEFEFLKPRGMRIKTVKLKGQISQGICFPLSILDYKRYPTDTRKYDVQYNFTEGMDVTPLLGVIKFENSIPACLSGVAKSQFPHFCPKTDETRVQILQPLLDKYIGFGCYISEKVDGSSVTFYYKDGEFGVCSRNLDLIEDDKNSLWKKAKEHEIKEKLKYIYEMGFDYKDPSAEDSMSLIKGNYALQGEIIGEEIQGNPLKLKGQFVYFYNAFNIDLRKYLDYYDFIKMMEFLNLPTVPIIKNNYVLCNNISSIVEMSMVKSKLNSDVWAEGIVIRPVVEIIDKSFNKLEHSGRVSFKCINPQYLLKNQL